MYIDELITGARNALSWAGISEQEKEERLTVVKEALTWLGTPYHHMGRVKGAGVDCGMLIAEVLEACGKVQHLEFSYYAADWAMHRSEEKYLSYMRQYFKPIEQRDPLPGDVLVHQFGRCVSHGGIVIFGNTFIHSYIKLGVVLADRNQPELAKREYGGYSVWGA